MINVETYHGLGLAQGLMSPWLAGRWPGLDVRNDIWLALARCWVLDTFPDFMLVSDSLGFIRRPSI